MPTLLLLLASASVALVPFEDGGKWGYKTRSGRVAISARYAAAGEFSTAGIAAVVDNSGWAWIDRGGRVLVRPLVVDNGPDEFAEGLARFRNAGKVGFFDSRGRIVIRARFDFALPFSECRAAACDGCVEVPDGEHRLVRGCRWGFIDRTGALVVPPRFAQVESFQGGRARVRDGESWRWIGPDGKAAPQ